MPIHTADVSKAKAAIKNLNGIATNEDKTQPQPTGEEMDKLLEVLCTAIKIEVATAVKAEFAKRDGQQQPVANSSNMLTGAPKADDYF